MMLHHFRPHGCGSLCEQWMSVYQDGSVAEYCEQFILLALPLTYMPEDALLSCFIKGLKPLIRVELRLQNPNTVEMAIEWAIKIVDKYVAGIEHSYYDPIFSFTPNTRPPFKSTPPPHKYPTLSRNPLPNPMNHLHQNHHSPPYTSFHPPPTTKNFQKPIV